MFPWERITKRGDINKGFKVLQAEDVTTAFTVFEPKQFQDSQSSMPYNINETRLLSMVCGWRFQ
jgi:hypothetical protein